MSNTFVSGLASSLKFPQAPSAQDQANSILAAGMRQKEIAMQQAWRERLLQEQERENEKKTFAATQMPIVASLIGKEKITKKEWEAGKKMWDAYTKTAGYRYFKAPEFESIIPQPIPGAKGTGIHFGDIVGGIGNMFKSFGEGSADFWTGSSEEDAWRNKVLEEDMPRIQQQEMLLRLLQQGK